jgi:hypothetical protein
VRHSWLVCFGISRRQCTPMSLALLLLLLLLLL